MNEVVLDLETMGVSSHAPILAIGAVRFDKEHGVHTDKFYRVISLKSNMELLLSPDADTVMWWMRQSESARSQLLRPSISLPAALEEFSCWIGEDAKVWGNGAAFDNVVLGNAYKTCSMKQPWEFYNDRCYRTMKNVVTNVPFERLGTHHNALDDAESQAAHLIKILKAVDGD